MSTDFSHRWAWAEVHTGLVQHNIAIVREAIGDVAVWAVVKANGYGHGSIPVAHAALAGGATGLCVALVDEGVALRRAGIQAPILLLSEQPSDQAELIVGYQLTPTITTTMGAAAIAMAAAQADRRVDVHIKVDTGMHRVGVSPAEVMSLVQFIKSYESLRIQGLYTHFAVADQPDHPANEAQLSAFNEVVARLDERGVKPELIHAANSAAALANPAARFNMVRVGIATYGLLPGPGVAAMCKGLIPAMAIKARVSALRWVKPGEAVSYGLRHPVTEETLIATVPIGYADGVPRLLTDANVPVLINGQPRRIAGTITMDQMMIDCGRDSSIAVGDEVVLLGRQGEHMVTADQWAEAIGTIGYEIVCGIAPRIYRRYA
jgi:alanine racemase